jgi:predicted TIM-barrel fold metal-dependent hydrolase
MLWIDTHCHLFTVPTADETTARLPGGVLNTAEQYLARFEKKSPAGIVVVDFSKAKTSEHVIAALEDLQRIGHDARGIIRGNLNDPRTLSWLKHPKVAGIRLYALTELPDLSDRLRWNPLFNRLRQYGQHICLFGKPVYLRQLLHQLPNDLPLLIDHLGMPDANESTNQADYAQLLAEAASRTRTAAPVFFKGPGYRTSLEPQRVLPFLSLILDKLGDSQLLLGASDAPFAGPVMEKSPRYADQPYHKYIGYDSILGYLHQLTQALAAVENKSEEIMATRLLYANARQLYRFDDSSRKVA